MQYALQQRVQEDDELPAKGQSCGQKKVAGATGQTHFNERMTHFQLRAKGSTGYAWEDCAVAALQRAAVGSGGATRGGEASQAASAIIGEDVKLP